MGERDAEERSVRGKHAHSVHSPTDANTAPSELQPCHSACSDPPSHVQTSTTPRTKTTATRCQPPPGQAATSGRLHRNALLPRDCARRTVLSPSLPKPGRLHHPGTPLPQHPSTPPQSCNLARIRRRPTQEVYQKTSCPPSAGRAFI